MSILKKIYLTLTPALIAFFLLLGFIGYKVSKEYTDNTYLSAAQSEVNSALIAAEYEQLGLVLLVKNIAASSTFLHYIQEPNIKNLVSLENDILTKLESNKSNQYGIHDIYLVDQQFNLVLSTLRKTPFEKVTIPDKVYEAAFDIHTKILSKQFFSEKGLSYLSLGDEVQYVYIMAIDPYLIPRDKRSKYSQNRYLLIAETPLKQMSSLLRKHNGESGITLYFNPTDSNQLPENTEFVIQSITKDSGTINVEMLSKHFSANLNIHESINTKNNNMAIFIVSLTATIIIGCLLISYIVIWQQLSKPLNNLLREIFSGYLQNHYFKRSQGSSEIDTIKNAYIDSLIELKFEAEFDQTTKLTNRQTFIRYLNMRLLSTKNINCYLVCWDIIDFKKINDLYGSKVGDQALRSFSKLFYDTLANHHYEFSFSCSDYSISRFGGNQFIAIIEVDSNQIINLEIEKINNILTKSTYVEGLNFKFSLTTCVLPMNVKDFKSKWSRTIEQMLRYTKRNKRNNDDSSNIVHANDLLPILEREDLIENILIDCCKNDKFKLSFMPIYNTKTMSIDGVEILIRCPSLLKIGVGPEEFIPIAEKSNLITKIDIWVIKKAIRCLKALQIKHLYKGTISINISAMELYNRNFVKILKSEIEICAIKPDSLIIEVTETSYVKSSPLTVKTIESMQKLGVKVSLDDFGTGYTAFNQLLHYPVDEIKIDKSFIDKITIDETGKKIVEQIVLLGQSCNACVVAEGVEQFEQYKFLSQIGCDFLQGYYFSKPTTIKNFIRLINNHNEESYLISLSKKTAVILQHKSR
ncbi:bifunctional diguanylate cyclase/phosphodiesterase [Vibrio sagamiensis]|uniref:GGDEF-domain containing protein n=1 Tax=Vibrio sagamiensis NBRC 104589 TaxID=1219064 RepID=A0A511QDL4_9VIBR|nr:bifunctional diguanylate cyclase/phosphodiesterase [Vibrio sagamiensis]GEM75398.1 hypothetical protein VSA01S_15100 [Vibrio sagamiensis NBRC 104589]